MSLYFIYTLIIRLSVFSVSGQTFYVSSAGNDNNSGLSQKNAWRTLDKINHLTIKSGSRIFFGGGSSFKGNLLLDENDGGDQNNRIIISSFGKGKAIIDAGEGTGIFVHNTSGINISKIIIKGNGVRKNKGSGFHFFADKKSGLYSGITVQNCINGISFLWDLCPIG